MFHRTQMNYVLTDSIVQQIIVLANKLKQPDHAICSLLSSLLFIQDPTQQFNELQCKLREILKEYCEQSNPISNCYTELAELFVQIRQISIQLKQRLKQCSLYNNTVQPSCIPSNSILDLL